MSKFKVGDRVVQRSGAGAGNKGDIFTVHETFIGDFLSKEKGAWVHSAHNYELYEEDNMQTFTKADLKTGMVVETREGEKAMVLLGTANGDIVSGTTWYALDSLTQDLRDPSSADCDIVKVYQPNYNSGYLGRGLHTNHKLIWERQELSPKQKEIKRIREEMENLANNLKELEQE